MVPLRSITMYDVRGPRLIEKSINRYVLNSPTQPGMKFNQGGPLTIGFQKASPARRGKPIGCPPLLDQSIGRCGLLAENRSPISQPANGAWMPPGITKEVN